METFEARSALEAKQYAEAQIARPATCPPWRHAVFGLMMGGLVATPAIDLPIRIAVLVVLLVLQFRSSSILTASGSGCSSTAIGAARPGSWRPAS